MNELKLSEIKQLIKQGYTYFVVEETNNMNYLQSPINIFSTRNKNKINKMKKDSPADFYISKNGKIIKIVVNGFILDFEKDFDKNINGIVYY